MPRKRVPNLQSPVQHASDGHLPQPVGKLPPITAQWLEATGQAVAKPADRPDPLESYVLSGDGRYSVNRAENGSIYHKWRWSKTKLKGRYVMFVHGPETSLHAGELSLVDKIADAEAGRIKAALDPYH